MGSGVESVLVPPSSAVKTFWEVVRVLVARIPLSESACVVV